MTTPVKYQHILTTKPIIKKKPMFYFKRKYLFRLDDACPTMNLHNWIRIEKLFDKYNIKPLIGVIPANADSNQIYRDDDPNFWQRLLDWQQKGWSIALHGFDHRYISESEGINPLWNRSEFAGVPLEIQKQKIANGYKILIDHGLNVGCFFAPSHTFDLNTIEALRECSDIRIISDTIGLKPYRKHGFIFVPQIGGHCFKLPIGGTFTFCFHPSVMKDSDFDKLETFLKTNHGDCQPFNSLDFSQVKSKGVLSKLLSFSYFMMRRMRK